MSHTTEIKVMDQLVVVNLDIHIWSARKKLLPQDFGNVTLPPEELASLGSKRVCNPEDLKLFGTLKARAVTLLERTGIRFLNGWTIPVEKRAEIDAGLAAIRDEFNAAKNSFLKRYGQAVREWIESHPVWGGIIEESVVSEDYVRSHLEFRWQVFRVSFPDSGSQAQDDLENDVKNLGDALYNEISKFAAETWKNCYAGKVEVTRKALSPLKTMQEKLLGLSFIEPGVSPIANLIGTALDSIPPRGPIVGGTLLMLQGLVSLLRTPQEIVQHGKLILGEKSTESVLAEIVSRQPNPARVESCSASSLLKFPGAYNTCHSPALESCGLW